MPQDETNALPAQHLKWCHARNGESHAGIRNLNPLGGHRWHYVRHDRVSVSKCVTDKPIVRHLEKSIDGNGFVLVGSVCC